MIYTDEFIIRRNKKQLLLNTINNLWKAGTGRLNDWSYELSKTAFTKTTNYIQTRFRVYTLLLNRDVRK